jgi:hypothetical protein
VPVRSARVGAANVKLKGASGSAVCLLAKSRAGGEALRGHSARESGTKAKGSSRLFEVRWSIFCHREGKKSEVI